MSTLVRPAVRASRKGFAAEDQTKWSRKEEQRVQLWLVVTERASWPSAGQGGGGQRWKEGPAQCLAEEESQT